METRLQHLIQELEDLVEGETESSDHPWLTRTVLEQLFHQKYGSTLENILQDYGYFDLKTFLRKSHIFAIYETPIPQNFYISLLRKTVPGYRQSSSSNQSMFYTVKRPWKVEKSTIKDLPNQGYSKKSAKVSPKNKSSKPISKKFNPTNKKIQSQDDLKFCLVEIVKYLLSNNRENYVKIDEINTIFYSNYGQNLREVRCNIFPDIKLIDILQTIPELKLEKIQNTWRITLGK
ncbi:hypothetical protein PL11201_80434 [Planktothrix sp. PCC 11201]|uniref:OST-HTH/LOTUS domain-containing protein n=1 Tax=Planktothrix sp. PCC 11201 TaxID=1729650 RepID=UPI0009121500|nr:OST-HTH/LOTUS domain-containing protein [Planktothrix sp. PCC 11201]SKB16124.1 hypothetical protein PL11201_80434 [Planktothrix sp. PCC 11201]